LIAILHSLARIWCEQMHMGANYTLIKCHEKNEKVIGDTQVSPRLFLVEFIIND
jgi:hypothetical protein